MATVLAATDLTDALVVDQFVCISKVEGGDLCHPQPGRTAVLVYFGYEWLI
jgi:hypothetical protein